MIESKTLGVMYSKPSFDLPCFQETDNIKSWIRQCKFILFFGGVKDQGKQVSYMSSRLPQPLQKTVIIELSKVGEDASKMTLEHFETLTESVFDNAIKEISFQNFLDKLPKKYKIRKCFLNKEKIKRKPLWIL